MIELLSPAGNYKAFLGAVNAGADAVYLGGTMYGARAYADNFTDEEIISAINYAHLFNVKVYLTVNTLIKEKEFSSVLEYIKPFYEAGLDACIVQDLGLISVFKSNFPNMECHISTQAFATGLSSVRFYKSLGASRVVLARELSLKEIKYIKENEDIELETFIHGAMCYSYSGECLFSSCLGGRSGNRGKCAGPCRLPYKVCADNKESNEGYFLSMKDQCTLELLPEIIEAGVDSLKIEGRMKKPEYAAFVTSIYRKYIDLYYKNPTKYTVDKKDLEALEHFYLRSDIQEGYYNNYNGKNMISVLNPGYNGSDEALIQYTQKKYLENSRRLPVNIYFYAHKDEETVLTLSYKDSFVSVTGPAFERSKKIKASKDDVIKQLSKLGDTFFFLNEAEIDIDDDLFIPVKSLNEMRREGISNLQNTILDAKKENKKFADNKLIVRDRRELNALPFIFVLKMEQLEAVLSSNIEANIAISAELVKCENVIDCLKKNEKKAFIALPFVYREKFTSVRNEIINLSYNDCFEGLVVRNTNDFYDLVNSKYLKSIIASQELYCWNKEAVNVIKNLADAMILPYELNKYELSDVCDETFVQYNMVYGKLPLMHSANCVIKTAFGCKKNDYDTDVTLKDRYNTSFFSYRNCLFCTNDLYNSVPTNLLGELNQNKEIFRNSVLSFTDEKGSEVLMVINDFQNALEGRYEQAKDAKFTKGYFKRGVE